MRRGAAGPAGRPRAHACRVLKTKDFWVSAIDLSATKDFTENDWKGKNVLLFGSEGYGLKSKTLMHSDFKFRVKINKNMERQIM